MKPIQISFEELAKLDEGILAIAMNRALKRAAEDCEDRPGIKKPRQITLRLDVTPILDQDGQCDEVKYGFTVQDRLPNRSSREYVFGLRKNGVLTCNPESIDAHNQHTFDFEGDE